jgi:hypothetical protein
MLAVWQKWQRFREDHGVERQSEINMWIRHAVAESFCVDRDKQQIVLAAEIFRGGRFGLVRGRKMNVTVGDIDRRAVKPPFVLGFAPQGGANWRQILISNISNFN